MCASTESKKLEGGGGFSSPKYFEGGFGLKEDLEQFKGKKLTFFHHTFPTEREILQALLKVARLLRKVWKLHDPMS